MFICNSHLFWLIIQVLWVVVLSSRAVDIWNFNRMHYLQLQELRSFRRMPKKVKIRVRLWLMIGQSLSSLVLSLSWGSLPDPNLHTECYCLSVLEEPSLTRVQIANIGNRSGGSVDWDRKDRWAS